MILIVGVTLCVGVIDGVVVGVIVGVTVRVGVLVGVLVNVGVGVWVISSIMYPISIGVQAEIEQSGQSGLNI